MIRLLGTGIVTLALVVGSVGTACPARAQAVPAADALREQFARDLPPLWHLDGFTLAPPPVTAPAPAPAQTKDGAQPVVTQPFVAEISLTVPTFVIESQRGPFTLLRPVAGQGTKKTLTGLAKSALKDGSWTVKFGIQNGYATDNIGLPLDRFPGRVAVIGSPEAAKLVAELDQAAKQQAEAEAEAQRRQQEALEQQLARVKADAQRIGADRAQIDQRAAALAELKRLLLDGDRTARIATLEAALNGKDASMRAMAFAAALTGRDAVVANLALRVFLGQKKSLPVQLFATRENKDSEAVLHNLGPLALTIDRFDPLTGNLEGKMGAPGYSIALPGSAFGYLAQTELTVNTYGCSLQLRLSEVETLDGVFRCQTLPPLIARITLD